MQKDTLSQKNLWRNDIGDDGVAGLVDTRIRRRRKLRYREEIQDTISIQKELDELCKRNKKDAAEVNQG